MTGDYVEQRNGGYYVAGTRVALASVVCQFQDGASPETIRHNFPTLSLEQVYGSIAFYLGHQDEVEAYLRGLDQKWEELERDAKTADPELRRRLEEARQRLLTKQA